MSETKKPFILNENREACRDCMTCITICPKSAIYLMDDDDGYEYPMVNKKVCTRCNMCKKACPVQ